MALTHIEIQKAARKDHPTIPWGIIHENIIISRIYVMQSAAGYYIGRCCLEEMDDGFLLYQPWSRESGYFSTKEEAQKYLDYLKK